MDSEHGSGNIQLSRTDAGATGNKGDEVDPLISFSDSDQESGSSRHPTTYPESTVNEGALVPSKKLSSSSDSSLEGFFQVDPNVISKSSAPIIAFPIPHEDAELLHRDDKMGLSNTPFKSEEHDTGSTVTSSAVSDLTNESMLHGMSPTQSPTIQVMERPGGYNPSRIPSSVFASKSHVPNDQWSVASNDSLFSIQIGNNSFSRDIMPGGYSYKSGELTKSSELIRLRSYPPATVGRESNQKSVDVGKNLRVAEAADQTMKRVSRTEGDQSEGNLPHLEGSSNSPTTHHRSDLRGTSRKKSSWPSCHCSNCGWAFCYRRCRSCYCSNCSWGFCYRWNCRQKRSCSCSTHTLTGERTSVSSKEPGGTSDLVEAEPEQQLSKSQTSEVTPKAASNKWFSCFSCCSNCC